MAAISSSAEEEGAGRSGPSAGPSEAPRRAAAPRSPSTPRANNRMGPCGRASITRRAGPLGAYSRSSVLHLDVIVAALLLGCAKSATVTRPSVMHEPIEPAHGAPAD